MLIISTRFVSEWLDPGAVQDAAALADGSPLDRLVFLGLILAGVVVLIRRHLNVVEVVRRNGWIVLFLFYCLLAVLWSDFPLVSLKRWLKVLGHPIMVLVIFTEPDPEEALRRLFRRCAYIVLPVSIMLVKYFPEWGRGFSFWTGEPENFGITTNKNALGQDCMVLGLFLVANLFRLRGVKSGGLARREEQLLCIGLLGMIWWLLAQSDSKTSLVALLAGVALMLSLGVGLVRRHAGAFIVTAVLVFATTQLNFDVYRSLVFSLGRNMTLTDRTALWDEVLKIDINPIVGAGFESFWLGERLERIWKIFPFQPVQAHNGYLETYLNLGYVGVCLLIGLFFATYRKARRDLQGNASSGRFRLGVLLAIGLYNYTEASFKALHVVWFVFYLIALEYETRRVEAESRAPFPLARRRLAPVGTSSVRQLEARDRTGVPASRPVRKSPVAR
jgi:O-antigen ligase